MGFLDRFKRKQPDLTPEEREAAVKKAVAKLEEDAVVGRAEEVVKAAERKHKAEREGEKRNLDRINREIRLLSFEPIKESHDITSLIVAFLA